MLEFKLTDKRPWWKQVIGGLTLFPFALLLLVLIASGMAAIAAFFMMMSTITLAQITDLVLTFGSLIGLFGLVMLFGVIFEWAQKDAGKDSDNDQVEEREGSEAEDRN